jgi:hypothetical protein
MSDVGGLLVASVIADVGGTGFLLVLPVSHVKAASAVVDVGFLSAGFLVVLLAGLSVAAFTSHMEAAPAITGPGLSSAGLSVVVVGGFSAADIMGARSGAGFPVVLVALSGAMFSSFVEVEFAGGDAAARAEPLIPLRLDVAVFLDLDPAMVEVVL